MNRAELDAWFAQADDVLTDWDGDVDAMHATPPTPGLEDELAPAGGSYYEQMPHRRVPRERYNNDWAPLRHADIVARIAHEEGVDGWAARAIAEQRMHDAFQHFATRWQDRMRAFAAGINQLAEHFRIAMATGALRHRHTPGPVLLQSPDAVTARALELRRIRNTGPAEPQRIDRQRH